QVTCLGPARKGGDVSVDHGDRDAGAGQATLEGRLGPTLAEGLGEGVGPDGDAAEAGPLGHVDELRERRLHQVGAAQAYVGNPDPHACELETQVGPGPPWRARSMRIGPGNGRSAGPIRSRGPALVDGPCPGVPCRSLLNATPCAGCVESVWRPCGERGGHRLNPGRSEANVARVEAIVRSPTTRFSSGPPSTLSAEVVRTRLLSALTARFDRSVSSIVAGAGFGKTTLLAQAIRQ